MNCYLVNMHYKSVTMLYIYTHFMCFGEVKCYSIFVIFKKLVRVVSLCSVPFTFFPSPG